MAADWSICRRRYIEAFACFRFELPGERLPLTGKPKVHLHDEEGRRPSLPSDVKRHVEHGPSRGTTEHRSASPCEGTQNTLQTHALGTASPQQ